MKNHNESVNKKIKLYLYLVICFVLSVLAQEISISNDLDINFLNIFFITLLIIIFYLLDRYSNQGALLNTKKEHKDIIEIPSDSNDSSDTHYIKLRESFNSLSGQFDILRQEIENKDNEILRYKEGYDSNKIKNFFSRFTAVDSIIKEYKNNNAIDLEGLNDIQIEMEEAFAEYDIELFYPKIGSDYRTAVGVAELTNKQKIATDNEDENLKIAKVIEPGYRRKIDLGEGSDIDFQIITNAKVAVFIYKL
jgi:hypothetical protein